MGNVLSEEIESENEKEYFDLINQKIETETKINSDQAINIGNKPKKYWKNVILHFLDKQYKLGITWCKELHQIIKTYQFSSERKFLDVFFWQRFEMRTKPKCLSKSPPSSLHSSMTTTNALPPEENNSNIFQSSKNLNDLTSSQYISNLSKNEYEKNKEKLKEYIKIFKKHLKNKEHPISICINLFVEIFSREIQLYTDEIEEIKNIDDKLDRAKTVTEAICQQLVFYLFKLQKCFGYMYSSIFNFKYFQDEKEEFTIMFSSVFFSYKKLYDLILNLLTLEKEKEIYDFCKHILILNESGIKPKHFKIDPKFCLDNDTIQFQLDFIKQKNIKLSEDELNIIKNYITKKEYIPYQTSIDLIKKVKLYQAPFDKMNILYSMGNDVIDNINNIWKPLEKFLPKNFLSVDGDELIKIFGYILIKAKMPEILSHLSFIKNFTTKDTKSSMIGYYYTTIEAGVILAKKMEEKDYFNEEKIENLENKDKNRKISGNSSTDISNNNHQ
jgi:hypothetical protein